MNDLMYFVGREVEDTLVAIQPEVALCGFNDSRDAGE